MCLSLQTHRQVSCCVFSGSVLRSNLLAWGPSPKITDIEKGRHNSNSDMHAADHPRGDTRPSSDGTNRQEGLIFMKGQEGRGDRADVGQGELRVKHPAGAPSLHLWPSCVHRKTANHCSTVFLVAVPRYPTNTPPTPTIMRHWYSN